MRGGAPARAAAPAGSVPARNHSSRGGSTPRAKLTGAARTPGGGAGGALGTSRCSQLITSSQIGAAPVTPLTSCIGAPEKLPTQTPTV